MALARSDYKKKLAEYDRDIADTEVELERREVQRRVDAERDALTQLDRRAEEKLAR